MKTLQELPEGCRWVGNTLFVPSSKTEATLLTIKDDGSLEINSDRWKPISEIARSKLGISKEIPSCQIGNNHCFVFGDIKKARETAIALAFYIINES